MFFSPVAERSIKVRALYASFYGLLSVGAVTMVLPFVLMLSGSMEPGTRFSDSIFFPSYLVANEPLKNRYLEAKYRNESDLFRMAWGKAGLDLGNPPPLPDPDKNELHLWRSFLSEKRPAEILFAAGFCAPAQRIPHYTNRAFRVWLRERFGDIDSLNAALGTTFKSFQAIAPPNISLVGGSLNRTPLVEYFLEYSRMVAPESRKFAWDAGGYYRAVFVPRLLGEDISAFNTKYGTDFKHYSQIPFSSTAPALGKDLWFAFVSKLVRPDFVELTPAGEERRRTSGLGKSEFIRVHAHPEDLEIRTIDRLFAEWCAARHGVDDARIPQAQLDAEALAAEATWWRGVFLTQNYRHVLDEILLHGHAMANTLLLVALKVLGALLVNPLAAYALSRFRLPATYIILFAFLLTLTFPAEVTMIPVFLQLREFSMLNTFWALVLPGLANGFSIFLLKGFFDSLPKELYEAAELDGAGEWRMFWMLTMGLSKPILAVTALGAFVSAYGAFFYALIVCPDPRMWTVMVYVYQLQGSAANPVIYASLILTAIPTLLVFIFCQNIILRGIVVPSEK